MAGKTGSLAMAIIKKLLFGLLMVCPAVLFIRVVSNETCFTGLAIVNPNAQGLAVRIELPNENGNTIATKDEAIGADRRVSKLLTEYFLQLAGMNGSLGYIRAKTDRGVASFALLGTQGLTELPAIPALPVR